MDTRKHISYIGLRTCGTNYILSKIVPVSYMVYILIYNLELYCMIREGHPGITNNDPHLIEVS